MRTITAVCLSLALLAAILPGGATRAAPEDNVWVNLDSNGAQFPAGSGSFSYAPAISADGRYIAFETLSTLTHEGDANSVEDVFLRDTGRPSSSEDDPGESARTTLLSAAVNGEQSNNRSYAPVISADASVVVFESLASNLVEGDGNNASDIFLRDIAAGATTRLSAVAGGDANGASFRPAISPDGAFVAFCSRASNLADGDGNSVADAFLLERGTGAVTRIAVESTTGGALDGCVSVAVSDGGSIVAFSASVAGRSDVFLYERASGSTTNVTAAATGSSGVTGVSISADGNIIAFDSIAPDLVTDDSNRSRDVFAFDRAAQVTTRASVRSDGSQLPGDSGRSSVAVSDNGQFVVFDSAARGVINGDTNNKPDVYRRELATGKTTLASASVFDGVPNDSSYSADINADGTIVAYTSLGGNIMYGDNNRQPDIFLRRNNFPESAGEGTGPVDTGAPSEGEDPLPVTGDSSGGIPTLAVIGAAIAGGVLLLIALSMFQGRRGKA